MLAGRGSSIKWLACNGGGGGHVTRDIATLVTGRAAIRRGMSHYCSVTWCGNSGAPLGPGRGHTSLAFIMQQ